MNIAALVSGGVDSTVSVHLLKDRGYDPHIFYIRIGMEDEKGFIECPSEEDIEITTSVARQYGCKLDIITLHREYWDNVIQYTIETVRKGLTPNPDMMCNKLIKFGVFEKKFGKDFDRISTGHYADILRKDDVAFLKTSTDSIKDQTYFLAELRQKQLLKIMFPLSVYWKKEVREIAKKNKLPSATRPDSQGICFLGKINYNDFIKRYVGEKEGAIVELKSGKILGKHRGNWFYTIGQRKGLGMSKGPWFVVKKNIEENIVYVAHADDEESQYDDKVHLRDFHFLSGPNNMDGSAIDEITYKIRHHPKFTPARFEQNAGRAVIHSKEMISGIAPGQFGVIYDKNKEICLGSGVIV